MLSPLRRALSFSRGACRGQFRFFAAAAKDQAAEISESRFEADVAKALERIHEATETSTDADSSLHEGVLRIEFPAGVLVLNKHALTKQIWYSSPVIGPAYFDAVTVAGKRWFSLKLERDVFDQFAHDVRKLANVKVLFPHQQD